MKPGWALLLACGSAFAAEEPKFSGGDGLSCENAVVPIVGEAGAIGPAERQWLEKAYGGGAPVRQALAESTDGKRRYDLILWRKPDGQTVDICIDVTTVFEDTIRDIEREEERGYPHSPAR